MALAPSPDELFGQAQHTIAPSPEQLFQQPQPTAPSPQDLFGQTQQVQAVAPTAVPVPTATSQPQVDPTTAQTEAWPGQLAVASPPQTRSLAPVLPPSTQAQPPTGLGNPTQLNTLQLPNSGPVVPTQTEDPNEAGKRAAFRATALPTLGAAIGAAGGPVGAAAGFGVGSLGNLVYNYLYPTAMQENPESNVAGAGFPYHAAKIGEGLVGMFGAGASVGKSLVEGAAQTYGPTYGADFLSQVPGLATRIRVMTAAAVGGFGAAQTVGERMEQYLQEEGGREANPLGKDTVPQALRQAAEAGGVLRKPGEDNSWMTTFRRGARAASVVGQIATAKTAVRLAEATHEALLLSNGLRSPELIASIAREIGFNVTDATAVTLASVFGDNPNATWKDYLREGLKTGALSIFLSSVFAHQNLRVEGKQLQKRLAFVNELQEKHGLTFEQARKVADQMEVLKQTPQAVLTDLMKNETPDPAVWNELEASYQHHEMYNPLEVGDRISPVNRVKAEHLVDGLSSFEDVVEALSRMVRSGDPEEIASVGEQLPYVRALAAEKWGSEAVAHATAQMKTVQVAARSLEKQKFGPLTQVFYEEIRKAGVSADQAKAGMWLYNQIAETHGKTLEQVVTDHILAVSHNLTPDQVLGTDVLYQVDAGHGGAARFTEPSLDYLLSGEGANAYSRGFYASEYVGENADKGVQRDYALKARDNKFVQSTEDWTKIKQITVGLQDSNAVFTSASGDKLFFRNDIEANMYSNLPYVAEVVVSGRSNHDGFINTILDLLQSPSMLNGFENEIGQTLREVLGVEDTKAYVYNFKLWPDKVSVATATESRRNPNAYFLADAREPLPVDAVKGVIDELRKLPTDPRPHLDSSLNRAKKEAMEFVMRSQQSVEHGAVDSLIEARRIKQGVEDIFDNTGFLEYNETAKIVNKIFVDAGIDGFQYVGTGGRASYRNFVVFDPTDTRIDTVDILRQDSGRGVAQGATEFLQDSKAVIHAFSQFDTSTFHHEMFHILRRFLPDSFSTGLEKELGVVGHVWTRENEETAARMWEQYLRTPEFRDKLSPTVANVFSRISMEMESLYRGVTNSPLENVTLSPSVVKELNGLVGEVSLTKPMHMTYGEVVQPGAENLPFDAEAAARARAVLDKEVEAPVAFKLRLGERIREAFYGHDIPMRDRIQAEMLKKGQAELGQQFENDMVGKRRAPGISRQEYTEARARIMDGMDSSPEFEKYTSDLTFMRRQLFVDEMDAMLGDRMRSSPGGMTPKEWLAEIQRLKVESEAKGDGVYAAAYEMGNRISAEYKLILDDLLDAGRITPEAHSALYDHFYSPFVQERFFAGTPYGDRISGRNLSDLSKGDREAIMPLMQGSTDVHKLDWQELLLRATNEKNRMIVQNDLANTTRQVVEAGGGEGIFSMAREGKAPPRGFQEITGYSNRDEDRGQPFGILIPEHWANEYNRGNILVANSLLWWANHLSGTSIVKAQVAYGPARWVKAPLRDWGGVIATHPAYKSLGMGTLEFSKDLQEVFVDVMGKGPMTQAALKQGLFPEPYSAQGRLNLPTTSDAPMAAKALVAYAHLSEAMNEKVEMLGKMALRQRMIKNGMPEEQASIEASKFMDPTQRGSWGPALDAFLPYFSFKTQGALALEQQLRQEPEVFRRKFLELGLATMGIAAWNAFNYPEAWKNIPFQWGSTHLTFVTPQTFTDEHGVEAQNTFGILLDEPVQTMYAPWYIAARTALGDPPTAVQAVQALLRAFPISQAGDLGSPLFKAYFGYTTNWNYQFGDKIWRGDDRVSPVNETSNNLTTYNEALKALGLTNVSPERADYVLTSLAGISLNNDSLIGGTVKALLQMSQGDKALPEQKKAMAQLLPKTFPANLFFKSVTSYGNVLDKARDAETASADTKAAQRLILDAYAKGYQATANDPKTQVAITERLVDTIQKDPTFNIFDSEKVLKGFFDTVTKQKLPSDYWVNALNSPAISPEQKAVAFVNMFNDATPKQKLEFVENEPRIKVFQQQNENPARPPIFSKLPAANVDNLSRYMIAREKAQADLGINIGRLTDLARRSLQASTPQ